MEEYNLDNRVHRDKINFYKNDIKLTSDRLYKMASPIIKNVLNFLFAGSISTKKTTNYYNYRRSIDAVRQCLAPTSHGIILKNRNTPIADHGVYYVSLDLKNGGHGVVVVKMDGANVLYDSNGPNGMRANNETFNTLERIFGTLEYSTAFNPHATEFSSNLAKNIFLTTGGRCAIWGLFICMCFELGGADLPTIRRNMDQFLPHLHGNNARIISSMLVSVYTRTLWLYSKPAVVKYTPMERALLSPVVTKQMSADFFSRFKRMRPQVIQAIETHGIQHQKYFQLESTKNNNNRSRWTLYKFVKTLENNGTLIINQYAKRKSVTGHDIPPPLHIKLKIKLKLSLNNTININASVPVDQIKEQDGSIKWKNILDWTNRKWNEKFGVLIREWKNGDKYAWIGDISELFTEKKTSKYEHFGNTYISKKQNRRQILHIGHIPILSTTTVLPLKRSVMFMLWFREVDKREIDHCYPVDVVNEQIVRRKNFHSLRPTLQRRDIGSDGYVDVQFMEMRVPTPVFIPWDDVEKLRTVAQVICTRRGVMGFHEGRYIQYLKYVESLDKPVEEERKRIHQLYESASHIFRKSTDYIVRINQEVRIEINQMGKKVWKRATNNILSPEKHKEILMDLSRGYDSLESNKLNDYELRKSIKMLLSKYFAYHGVIGSDLIERIQRGAVVFQGKKGTTCYKLDRVDLTAVRKGGNQRLR